MASLYNSADTGVGNYKTAFPFNFERDQDIPFGKLVPVMCKLGVPNDIWKLREKILLRFEAQTAPFFTPVTATVRAWFVPLRLLEENTEKVITGSKNGKVLSESDLPVLDGLFDYDTGKTNAYTVAKNKAVELIYGLPKTPLPSGGNYDFFSADSKNSKPALFYLKAYFRIWFDYYRDENLFEYDDFDEWWQSILESDDPIGQLDLLPVNWRKDYLTSALYAQQKGIAPTLDMSLSNVSGDLELLDIYSKPHDKSYAHGTDDNYQLLENKYTRAAPTGVMSGYGSHPDPTILGTFINRATNNFTGWTNYRIEQGAGLDMKGTFNGLALTGATGISASDLRLLFAQQRLFERLMRCGSRYTEYLKSNFGISPTDETLQRAQYLGGFKQPVITSEVLQTAEGSNPVGTQRGHSISAGRSGLGNHLIKEFGVIMITISVMPKAQYTQGISREFMLRERFDFPNPSFQFLSEDEVKNYEVYLDSKATGDDKAEVAAANFSTFGFQEMYGWLKSARDEVRGSFRDTKANWTMARIFSSRPNLNEAFVTTENDSANFNRPFAVTISDGEPPILMRLGHEHIAWRPFARFGTPGLLDHH